MEAQAYTTEPAKPGVRIIAPQFHIVKCPACHADVPEAMAYHLINDLHADKTGETYACSYDCAQHIKRVWESGWE